MDVLGDPLLMGQLNQLLRALADRLAGCYDSLLL